MAHTLGKADGRFGGKILCSDGADQADDGKSKQNGAIGEHQLFVVLCDADVDDGGNHQWHEQLKGSLQQLEQRSEDRFQRVGFKILEQIFQR